MLDNNTTREPVRREENGPTCKELAGFGGLLTEKRIGTSATLANIAYLVTGATPDWESLSMVTDYQWELVREETGSAWTRRWYDLKCPGLDFPLLRAAVRETDGSLDYEFEIWAGGDDMTLRIIWTKGGYGTAAATAGRKEIGPVAAMARVRQSDAYLAGVLLAVTNLAG